MSFAVKWSTEQQTLNVDAKRRAIASRIRSRTVHGKSCVLKRELAPLEASSPETLPRSTQQSTQTTISD